IPTTLNRPTQTKSSSWGLRVAERPQRNTLRLSAAEAGPKETQSGQSTRAELEAQRRWPRKWPQGRERERHCLTKRQLADIGGTFWRYLTVSTPAVGSK